MKPILTFIAALFISGMALAQSTNKHDKVNVIEMGVVLDFSNKTQTDFKQISTAPGQKVARLYRNKNSRVHKELAFSTKKSRPKLA